MEEFREKIEEIIRKAKSIYNPNPNELKEKALSYSVKNKNGYLLFHTKIKARVPKNTIENINVLSKEEKLKIIEELEKIEEYLCGKRLYVIDRNIGASKKNSLKARAVVSYKYPHLALMFHRNYFHPHEDVPPDIITLMIPEWENLAVYVDPETLTNVILGSDYYGELKMSILRLAMNFARDSMGMIGVHAGSKLYKVYNGKGKLVKRGVLVFGLSGTGKSLITMSDHGINALEGDERVTVRQDDIVFLTMNGRALGSERNLYPKTDSISEVPPLMEAVKNPETIFENVAVDSNGFIDFSNVSFCPNARALVMRDAIPYADGCIDLEHVDIFLFLTRRTEMPIAAKLCNPEQTIAYFMLGESTQTSAATMKLDEVGKPIRVPGFDPFMLEPKWWTAIRLYEFLKRNSHIEAYLLNTGYIGEVKIPPEDTKKTVLAIVKGTVKWVYDKNLKLQIPESIPGVNVEKYDPYRVFGEENYKMIIEELRRDRKHYLLENFPQISFVVKHI